MAKKSDKVYMLKFDQSGLSMEGKKIEEVIEEEIARSNMLCMSVARRELTEPEISIIKKSIKVQGEKEKDILQTLIQTAIESKEHKGLAHFNQLADLAAQVKDAGADVELNGDDLEWLRKAFEEVKEKPSWWKNCREVFLQLQSPEEKKQEAQESK
jgi:hypothetical protein